MARIVGWVIVNNGKLYAGDKHPSTQKIGTPIWVESLVNTNFDGGPAAVYETERLAAEISSSLWKSYNIDAAFVPVLLGVD